MPSILSAPTPVPVKGFSGSLGCAAKRPPTCAATVPCAMLSSDSAMRTARAKAGRVLPAEEHCNGTVSADDRQYPGTGSGRGRYPWPLPAPATMPGCGRVRSGGGPPVQRR
ncbi:hypothetical protein T1E_2207 [Pseudomonas putida DOT-T1E]|uniref:Uncharacterized protein n=1 Tax=Pseudomonas putida (strain DOT-T1E) TaxID=1196325 RepID=I7AZB8_PSEPT|nr:hypothetical protein T1E_2207 [Pseudomonas putida DOT-T1E]